MITVLCGCAQPAAGPRARQAATASAPSVAEPVWTQSPDAEFRKYAPGPEREGAWQAPAPDESMLPNGMRVLTVVRNNLPIVVVHIATRGGADRQPLAGLGSFVGEMLEQGTTKRDTMSMSEAFASLGAEHHAWVDWDSGNVWVKVLADRLDPALALVAEVVQQPAFAQAEVERLKAQRLARLSQRNDAPDALLRDTIARVVYGSHVYGQPLIGTRETVEKVTAEQCRAFHESVFQPDRMHVAVVGDINASQVIARLKELLGEWKPTRRPLPRLAPPPAGRPGVFVVDRPGATQSHVAFAGPGLARANPDADAAMVANAILGGMGTSRLNTNLREDHGWTYGAKSTLDMRIGPGPLVAGAAIETAHTVDAIKEMVAEFDKLRTSDPTEHELSRARNSLVRTLPGKFESNVATASSVAWLGVYGLPLDEYRSMPGRIDRVGAEEVRKIVTRYMDRRKLRLVIVGDARRFQSELPALGLGAVTMLDGEGKPTKR